MPNLTCCRRAIAGTVACHALACGVVAPPVQSPARATAPAPAVSAALDLTDRASVRNEVRRIVNKRRRLHGCAGLDDNPGLRRAAQRHSRKMASRELMQHVLSGELGVVARIEREGYRGWTRLGENIAEGYWTPRDVVRAWMQSPGHRANILNCSYDHIGIGIAVADDADSTPYWTQDFGAE